MWFGGAGRCRWVSATSDASDGWVQGSCTRDSSLGTLPADDCVTRCRTGGSAGSGWEKEMEGGGKGSGRTGCGEGG